MAGVGARHWRRICCKSNGDVILGVQFGTDACARVAKAAVAEPE